MKSTVNKCLALAAILMAGLAWATLPEPIVRWTMDSIDANGQIPDATGGGNALELGPNMKLKSEKFFGGSKVLDCDGSTDCWARSTKKIAVGSRTISFWAYRPCQRSEDKNLYLISNLSGSGINCSNNGIGMRMLIDNKYPVDGAMGIGAWCHVVMTVDITSTVGDKSYVSYNFFRNGESYKSVSDFELTTAKFVNVSSLVTVANDTVNGNRGFYGALRDIRVYDQVLTLAQTKELYTNTLHERPLRTLGFWRMEDSAEDATGEGLPLNLGEDVAYVADGISGKALNFLDSVNAYTYQTNDVPPFTDITLAMWMRPERGVANLSALVNNTLPHVFTLQTSNKEYYRLCINMRGDLQKTLNMSDMAFVDDSSSSTYETGNVYLEKGIWSHFAFVAKAEYDSENSEWYVEPKYYCNGELITTGRRTTCAAFKTFGRYPDDLKLVLGNRGYPNNRAFWGQMDDVALISGALTADEVKGLYAGVPEVDAGADFATTSAAAKLAGSLTVVHSGNEGRAVAASTTAWSLVSAPSGGEGVTIEATDDLETRVNLPVEGAYTFRLTVTSGPIMIHDEVVVTRSAPSSNTPPTISVAGVGNAYVGIPFTLKATVADTDEGPGAVRTTWRRVSGPEAVLFEPAVGTKVTATFYQAGNYVIRAIADDGAETTSADLAVTVAAATGDVTDGLMYYVQFDGVTFADTVGGYDTPWSNFYDHYKVRVSHGVYRYGITVHDPFKASLVMLKNGGGWTLQEKDADGKTEGGKPTNAYRAFSCWVKYDANSDTNSAFHSVIFEQRYNLGLMYDRENGKDVLRTYQNNGGANGDGFDIYTLTDTDMAKDWVHVYVLFDRCNSYASNVSELWVNGVKQTATQKYMGYGRARGKYLEIGGLNCDKGTAGFSNHWTNNAGESLSRTFPGYIDEFRMYSRNLNEAEIKMLAMHPAPDVNHPPAVNGVTGDLADDAHQAIAIESAATDDGMPTGSTLSYQWVVLAGEATNLEFANQSAKATTVKALKAGTYVLSLRATDGARVTYSPSIVFEAAKVGLVILLR